MPSRTEAALGPQETNFPSSQTPASFPSRSACSVERSEAGLVENAVSLREEEPHYFFRGGEGLFSPARLPMYVG